MERTLETFVFIAEVKVKAENEADARIELLDLMNAHDIYWELEEQE